LPPPKKKKHNFISHNSSIHPQAPIYPIRNKIPWEKLKKEKDITQKFKNTKENNKLDGAGLLSTATGETISRALMRLRAVVTAEDA